jgi:hypothetical protein
VGGRLLNVAERDACVEGGRDKGMPQRVRADLLGDPGTAVNPAGEAKPSYDAIRV